MGQKSIGTLRAWILATFYHMLNILSSIFVRIFGSDLYSLSLNADLVFYRNDASFYVIWHFPDYLTGLQAFGVVLRPCEAGA